MPSSTRRPPSTRRGATRPSASPRGSWRPTIAPFGTDEQQARFIRPFLRTEMLCCQLFSEPGAGSDLAGLRYLGGTATATSGWSTARRCGARALASRPAGELICRTDAAVPKHAGLTAFLLPIDTPGIEVRPDPPDDRRVLVQRGVLRPTCGCPTRSGSAPPATGGTSPSPPSRSSGPASGRPRAPSPAGRGGGSRRWPTWAGVTGDPVVRQQLAALYSLDRHPHAERRAGRGGVDARRRRPARCTRPRSCSGPSG